MFKLSALNLAMLLLAFVVATFTVAVATMLVRGTPIPDWLSAKGSAVFTLLLGIVLPSPFQQAPAPVTNITNAAPPAEK
jgi:hypothetical protein